MGILDVLAIIFIDNKRLFAQSFNICGLQKLNMLIFYLF